MSSEDCAHSSPRALGSDPCALGSGPCALGFDPFTTEFDRNPHPILAHLREAHRVYDWQEMNARLLTRHADVDWLLKHAPAGTDPIHWRGGPADAATGDSPWDRLRRETITFKEGAEHARLRRAVSRTFTRSACERLVGPIRSMVEHALDEVEANGGELDLVRDLSSRIPIQVLGLLVGVTPATEAEFCLHAVRLQNAINPLSDAAAMARADEAALGFRTMIGEIIEDAEKRPREHLVSALVHHDEEDGRLSHREILGITTSIIMAGAESTGALVNHGLLALLRNPDQLTLLRAAPAHLATAVDELGRFDFPTKFVTRYLLADVEIGGERLAKGQLIFGSPGAANRDPRVFERPDELDVTRPVGPTLTFGAGAHFCLGASLARVEAREMIGQLVTRFARIEPRDAPCFERHFNIRLISSLPLFVAR